MICLRRFEAGLIELPAIAAKPATIAPINAVIRISKTEDPPKGNTCAIL